MTASQNTAPDHLSASSSNSSLPMYLCDSPVSAVRLGDAACVLSDLESIDWAFETADTGFLTHDVHPYPAKFIPQIPGHLIARLSLPGDLILDPFGGSGTTALEAVRLGRRALSIDANPISELIGRVKTTPIDAEASHDLDAIRSSALALLESHVSSLTLLASHAAMVPSILHREKWFADNVTGELAFIRDVIHMASSSSARDVAHIALSRTVQSSSFQDSETRYVSVPRQIEDGDTLRQFIHDLDRVVRSVRETDDHVRYGVATFMSGDAADTLRDLAAESADLLVTSPPYGNAYDYHLYMRFRLLWLGHDPRSLGHIEIGSHLRHQREQNGLEKYLSELGAVMTECHRVLRPGRWAAFVVGDPVYGGVTSNITEAISSLVPNTGFVLQGCIERPLHRTKRSVPQAARRADKEYIVVLRRPPRRMHVELIPPPYKLWNYERTLRQRETQRVLDSSSVSTGDSPFSANLDDVQVHSARRLAFTHGVSIDGEAPELTWQAILENGSAHVGASSRKDPKYVTHGLHAFKGKFYPQLAKALLNIAGVQPRASVLDPFCGSGTTLLESYLNGLRAHGMDMNPLAAQMAAAKVGILDLSPSLVEAAHHALLEQLARRQTDTSNLDQIDDSVHDEVRSWFAAPVAAKLNLVLRCIRSVSAGMLRQYLEILLSDIIREVSHQEPRDLRIRRRSVPLEDADVVGIYVNRLTQQYERLVRFWRVRGYSPFSFESAIIAAGDSREWAALQSIGIDRESVDMVLTSPPYASALPYVDTDRLSLLVLHGMSSRTRRPLEMELTGSREIVDGRRLALEAELRARESLDSLPPGVVAFLSDLLDAMDKAEVGFRRRNLPALMLRYCRDMNKVLVNCTGALTVGGNAMIVIGDSRTTIEGEPRVIPTTALVEEIAVAAGLQLIERIPIDVTTDNSVHRKNSITENTVLWLRKA